MEAPRRVRGCTTSYSPRDSRPCKRDDDHCSSSPTATLLLDQNAPAGHPARREGNRGRPRAESGQLAAATGLSWIVSGGDSDAAYKGNCRAGHGTARP